MTDPQWVYRFGGGIAEGDASMKNLLGGKGANLADMAALGIPGSAGAARVYDLHRVVHGLLR